jgi:hypothetical protein
MSEPDPATRPAAKQGDTADGPVTARCNRPAGHDGRHEGRTGRPPGMPVYWGHERDGQQPSASR